MKIASIVFVCGYLLACSAPSTDKPQNNTAKPKKK